MKKCENGRTVHNFFGCAFRSEGGDRLAWFPGALLLVNSVCIAIGYPAFTILSLSGIPIVRQGIAAGLPSAIYSVGTG
ncbi:MAG TPA: hypothetical protein VNS58_04880 [Puia sp.]|nr:hypothetical protein [Puia sp.]